MQTNIFPSSTIGGKRTANPDLDMTLDLFIGDGAEVCVFHDKPFNKTLSWIEYDTRNSKIDFVMEDGDVRNFGIEVERRWNPYFQNAHTISMIEINPVTKKVVVGMDLPLIIHPA